MSFNKYFSSKSPLKLKENSESVIDDVSLETVESPSFKPYKNKKRKNKKQYGGKTKGVFNVTLKNKDKKQKNQTNKSVWKSKKKCFNMKADGTCENPNNEIV